VGNFLKKSKQRSRDSSANVQIVTRSSIVYYSRWDRHLDTRVLTLDIDDSALLVVKAKNLQETIGIDIGMDRPYRHVVASPVC